MLLVWKILEKVLMYIVVSSISLVAAVSAVTGKFPPALEDINRIYNLGKKIYEQNQAFKQAQGKLKPTEEGEASLEQIVQFQKLNYERMQTIYEFSKVVKLFPQSAGNRQIEERLRAISGHLEKAENEILFVQEEMKKQPPISF